MASFSSGQYDKRWQNKAAGRGWTPPPAAALQNATRQDPLGAAAASASQPRSTGELPGGRAGGSPTYGRGMGQKPAGSPSSQSNYSNTGVNSTNAWYGQGNEYGANAMASDSGAFWMGYGDQVMGNSPGGNATAFLSNKYNTQALGNVLYGRDFISDEDKLAGQSSIADAIAAPGVQFFDPGTLVNGVMQALQSNDPEALARQNPMLAGLLQSVQGNPAGQVDTIIGFLQELLSASMPADTLNAVLSQIQSLGQVFTQGLLRGDMANVDNANFATFLTQRLGPTLGL
jgi:hypothetical protein